MTKIRALSPNWVPSEEVLLHDLYPDLPCSDIAALLGREQGGVYQAAAFALVSKTWEAAGRLPHTRSRSALVINTAHLHQLGGYRAKGVVT